MKADQETFRQLPREALEEIAFAASTALSRYLDHEPQPGFPPGECAWAMGHDLRRVFDRHGVTVEPFGELARKAGWR